MIGEEKRMGGRGGNKIRAIRNTTSLPKVSTLPELIKKARAIFEQGTMRQRDWLRVMIEELHREMAEEKSFNRNLRLVEKTGEHSEGVNHD